MKTVSMATAILTSDPSLFVTREKAKEQIYQDNYAESSVSLHAFMDLTTF